MRRRESISISTGCRGRHFHPRSNIRAPRDLSVALCSRALMGADEERVRRGVAARLAIVAIIWTWAAGRLAVLGWPWALSAGGAASALAVALGLALGAAQGWFIARRSGARIVRWSREAATRRSRD